MSSIYKDGKYYKAELIRGDRKEVIHLGTAEDVVIHVRRSKDLRNFRLCDDCRDLTDW